MVDNLQRLLAHFRKLLSSPTHGIPLKKTAVVWRVMLACLPMLVLSGCLKHTRILERPQAPAVVLTATPQQLIQQVDERFDAIHSVNATVLIRASVGGATNGKETDYTSIRGYILLRRPSMLRVLGMLPVIETRAFDMVSNGKNFTEKPRRHRHRYGHHAILQSVDEPATGGVLRFDVDQESGSGRPGLRHQRYRHCARSENSPPDGGAGL
jgi:hypothetical protein